MISTKTQTFCRIEGGGYPSLSRSQGSPSLELVQMAPRPLKNGLGQLCQGQPPLAAVIATCALWLLT